MSEITISMDLLLGILLGILLPTLAWGIKMLSLSLQLRNMHLEPDEHGFGSSNLETALTEHLRNDVSFHQDYINSNKALRYAINEMAHFMRWMAKERTGKEPPPYVRDVEPGESDDRHN